MTRPSWVENAEGCVLTASLMTWFRDFYTDPAERSDPKASPLRAPDLLMLQPAFIVTCQFDPQRDEGLAYGRALAAAGVPVRRTTARGRTHTSLTMVGVLVSGMPVRAEMADAQCGFFSAVVPA